MIYPRWLQDLSRADFLKSVGLYVMPDRIFLVRARKNLWRLSLLEEESREIPPAEDANARRQALSEAIRSLLPHFDPARDPVYLCLSPQHAMGLELLLPQAAEENLAQVLEYEIERHIPFRREDVYYDFVPMGKKGDKVGVFLFAVPKNTLDEILDTLSSFGIGLKGIETTTTAISNYLLFSTGALTGPAIVLGNQDRAWEIIGLDARGNGWRREYEILFSYWLPQVEWIHGPGKAIFHDCLRASAKFFGWGYISDLLLSLGADSLQAEDLIALGKQKLGGEKEMSHSLFLPALGAALRGLRESAFPINLLPGAGKETRSTALSWLNVSLAALLLIGLIVWGGSYPVKDELRLRQLRTENRKLAPAVEALRKEEGELNRLRGEISFLAGQKERRGEIFLVLDELSRIVPNNAYLSNLRYREMAVELQGSAENTSSLVPLLERSPVFRNVGFTAPSNRGRDNRETFSLKAELERGEEKGKRPKP
ncbi:MAG: PilN domain-containing protein [Deltaproteobacteria bacterium]|nr:PilN domain-containing protein [Deltaproteobacteria bacterium]